ncbi:MAG: hypothetical protein ACI841_003003 [Planctomycetota bacterium]
MAASHLPYSLHLSVPGCHGVQNSDCVRSIMRAFLGQAALDGLPVSWIEAMHMPPFALTKK